ncbi:MAG TPA: ABC transporter permease [Bacteroidales bacterium]|nr:MAG: ABC transporter permease [Bacteroidetes bacterium GWE2_42_24]OFY27298.1 MAG: ABC transporter permease [Bacteroidetes bacterium GWF2_43_11]HAQ65079.1 ABC transporter permease [Bacteroidales bacterium]HBZ65956.1 ABC transporter permease [Bacteroidales bacterium]
MRTIGYIIQKEFIQIFRDRFMPKIIFAVPLFQLLLLSYAATFEIKQTRIVILDNDRSVESRRLVSLFQGSSFFSSLTDVEGIEEAEKLINTRRVHQILTIPRGFERKMIVEKSVTLQLITDAVDGSAGSIRSAYAQSIIQRYSMLINTRVTGLNITQPIVATWSFWYNPELQYTTFMVPGILVLLVTIIGLFLTGINLVREKEMGTIEQINVTPIKKIQFIAGKLIPFWIIGLVELTFGLILARLVFDVPILGNPAIIYLVAGIYLVLIMGIGLIISTVSDTQQQSMFISWFFLVLFILMSGLFTPAESMPAWAQIFNKINPIAYFIQVIRLVMLKGSGLADVSVQLISLSVYAFASIVIAVHHYKKTV